MAFDTLTRPHTVPIAHTGMANLHVGQPYFCERFRVSQEKALSDSRAERRPGRLNIGIGQNFEAIVNRIDQNEATRHSIWGFLSYPLLCDGGAKARDDMTEIHQRCGGMTYCLESGWRVIVRRRPEVEHKDIGLTTDLRSLHRGGEWRTHDPETRGPGVEEDLSSIAYSTLCRCEHLEQFQVAAVPAHTDVTWIVRQEVNEEGQDMPRIIRDAVEGLG